MGIEIARQNFASYPVAGNKFIIVNMYSIRNKQMILNKIRVKKSLMVEEVFKEKSNSQIYLNDHLTPYFNRLFLIARNAKKDGKLASASSYGGKIRARKSLDDAPIVITTEKQLQSLIDNDVSYVSDNSNNSVQLVDDNTVIHQSTPRPTTNGANKPRKASTSTQKTNEAHKAAPRGRRVEAKKRKNNSSNNKYDLDQGLHTKRTKRNAGSTDISPLGNAQKKNT